MKKYNYKLTAKEKQILKDVEAGKYIAVANLTDELSRDQKIAQATIAKNKPITIKVNRYDLLKIKAKAVSNGMPYQTLISSILHQFASGSLQVIL